MHLTTNYQLRLRIIKFNNAWSLPIFTSISITPIFCDQLEEVEVHRVKLYVLYRHLEVSLIYAEEQLYLSSED